MMCMKMMVNQNHATNQRVMNKDNNMMITNKRNPDQTKINNTMRNLDRTIVNDTMIMRQTIHTQCLLSITNLKKRLDQVSQLFLNKTAPKTHHAQVIK